MFKIFSQVVNEGMDDFKSWHLFCSTCTWNQNWIICTYQWKHFWSAAFPHSSDHVCTEHRTVLCHQNLPLHLCFTDVKQSYVWSKTVAAQAVYTCMTVVNTCRLTRKVHVFPALVWFVISSSVFWLQAGHSLSLLFITVTQSGLLGLQQVLINVSSWWMKAFRKMIFQFWAGIQKGTHKYQASNSASTLPSHLLSMAIMLSTAD